MMPASARMQSGTPLGAPGVYTLPDEAVPQLGPQRMDVCAFAGVAPRGPAYVPMVDHRYPDGYRMMADLDRPRRRSVPVAVRSFDDYRRLFGAFEGPGLLPYAVAAFFEQGGQRAYIVRVVPVQAQAVPGGAPPQPGHLAKLAQGTVGGLCTFDLPFFSRNEGSWGNALRVELGFATRALGFRRGAGNAVLLDQPHLAGAGTLLRLTDGLGVEQLQMCRGVAELRDPGMPVSTWRLLFDTALATAPVRVDIVETWLTVDDGAGRMEHFEQLGLHPDHPRSLASVLCNESALLWPHFSWAGAELMPAGARVELLRAASAPFTGGRDAYADLVPDDFFDAGWSPAEETPGAGITSLAELPDLTHVLAPDLYVPAQWAGPDTSVEVRIDQAGADFAPCVHGVAATQASSTPPSVLAGLLLDPRRASDLAQVAALQNRIVAFCEQTQDAIALLDVPPGLSQGQAERWRTAFDSSWCAAYHPWLIASRRAPATARDRLDTLRPMPPSAVAAGIIARKELRHGIQYGPANEVALEVVSLAEALPDGRAGAFHPQGLNCFVRAADGIHLVSARTLARDPQWRQLSVRRLVLMLRRTLLRETQWAVFETNGPKLWADLRHAIGNMLRRLYQAGAFAGATEAESYFVRVRPERQLQDRGQLVVEIGVAPAEPLEFILLQLHRAGDGTLTLETN
jgi:hypothetical protein